MVTYCGHRGEGQRTRFAWTSGSAGLPSTSPHSAASAAAALMATRLSLAGAAMTSCAAFCFADAARTDVSPDVEPPRRSRMSISSCTPSVALNLQHACMHVAMSFIFVSVL